MVGELRRRLFGTLTLTISLADSAGTKVKGESWKKEKEEKWSRCMLLGHDLRKLENRLHLSCVVGLL
ncbi:hypothetical protein P8452_56738 [Trifolium repens]|nr:hypothetical protein P8452_56738 [Trifolium repens]